MFEPALGRMALVCGLVAHAFHAQPAVETLCAWIVSFAVLPCAVAVRSLAVYGLLAVSWHSL